MKASLALPAALLAFACGNSDNTSVLGGGAGGDDGRFRPDPSGVHTTETAACALLQGAFQERSAALKCSKTIRTCPEFLRVQFGTACMEYDEGTVQACVDHYRSRSSCELLVDSECVVAPYPGTEPGGC